VWTRWQNLIFAAVWMAVLLSVELHSTANERTKNTNAYKINATGTKRWNAIFRVALVFGVSALVLFPQVMIRTTTNAPLAGQSWLEGWSIANTFGRSFDTVDGHFEYALPVAMFYAQVIAHPAYLFVMLTPFLGAGVVAPGKRMNSLLLLGWSFGMYFFLAGIPYENFRFMLGMFVPLAVFAGMGVGWVWEKMRARERLESLLLVVWIGVALGVMLFWQPRVLAPILEIKARELRQTEWLQTKLLPNALLFTMSIDGAVKTYSQIRVINLWDIEPSALQQNIPTYLYVDTNTIALQWRGRLPDQLVRELTATNNLHPLASFDGWTLFRIRDCKFRVMDCE
jgi:hypothetical protein